MDILKKEHDIINIQIKIILKDMKQCIDNFDLSPNQAGRLVTRSVSLAGLSHEICTLKKIAKELGIEL